MNAPQQFPQISDRSVGDHLVKTVDGREVHRFLGAKKDYTTWIKDRIAKFGFVENVDYVQISHSPILGSGNRGARDEYYLTIGMGKELGMVDRSEKGRAIRKYFLSIEEQAVLIDHPKTTAEILIEMLQLQVEVERRQSANEALIKAIDAKVDVVANAHVILDKMPSDCESIERIRRRMSKTYGLSAPVVTRIMRHSPLAATTRVLVRNTHVNADGAHYQGFAKMEVTAIFKRFVSECRQVTSTMCEHDYIEGRFRLIKNS